MRCDRPIRIYMIEKVTKHKREKCVCATLMGNNAAIHFVICIEMLDRLNTVGQKGVWLSVQ